MAKPQPSTHAASPAVGTVPRSRTVLGFRVPEPGYSWLCRDRVERERFLDIDRRMMRTNTWLTVLLFVLVLPEIIGAQLLPRLILAGTIACFGLVRLVYRRSRHPEMVVAAMLMTVEAGLAATIVAAGDQHTGALAIMLWPVAGFSARYPSRVAAAAAALVTLMIVAAELGFDGSAVLREPVGLTALLGAVCAVAAITNGARLADIQHRHLSNHDPLTGLFNRTALLRRVPEVEHQSRLNGEPVAVVLGDIDHFKSINDGHGHAKGDAVLRDVAEIARRSLRSFDPIYRLGGEEFVTLLLGRDADSAQAIAEALRLAVCENDIAGVPVTISFGVAASAPGDPFCWDDVFVAADRALYEAKRNGRNRVSVGTSGERVSIDAHSNDKPVSDSAISEAVLPVRS